MINLQKTKDFNNIFTKLQNNTKSKFQNLQFYNYDFIYTYMYIYNFTITHYIILQLRFYNYIYIENLTILHYLSNTFLNIITSNLKAEFQHNS